LPPFREKRCQGKNIHLGGTATVIKATMEEKRIAIKAAKAMDLKVAGLILFVLPKAFI
jgi:glutathione synthase/RimK-type ligase-like ATP-grasp enzyme